MPDTIENLEKRVYAAADRFIAHDRSDPFLRARVYHMLRSGHQLDQTGGLLFDAETATESVSLPEGQTFSNGETTYQRTVYRSLRRA